MLVAILIVCGLALIVNLFVFFNVASSKQVDTVKEKVKEVDSRIDGLHDDVRAIYHRSNQDSGLPAKIERQIDQSMEDVKDYVRRMSYGVNESTYRMLKSLVKAVDENDAGALAECVRAAKHVCGQYETADAAAHGELVLVEAGN